MNGARAPTDGGRPVRPSPGGLFLIALRGFAIGAAILIPGVSGGTVALVTGIYLRLLAAIGGASAAVSRFLRADLRGAVRAMRQTDWWFLITVVAGAVLALLSLAGVVGALLRNYPIRTAAVFFGLIAGSVVVAWRIMRAPSAFHAAAIAAVGAAAFYLFGFRSSAVVADPAWYVFLGAGVMAVCAFILPGISGSFLLLAVGMYQNVLAAIDEIHLPTLAVYYGGWAFGLAVLSRFLEWLLDRWHDLVVAFMVGLMLGSFRILWPWPDGLGGDTGLGAPGADWAAPTLLAVGSAVLVVLLVFWADRTNNPALPPPE